MKTQHKILRSFLQEWQEWIASLLAIIGCLLLALNSLVLSKWAYLFLLPSTLGWLVLSWQRHMPHLALLNIVLSFINVWGLYAWIIIPLLSSQ